VLQVTLSGSVHSLQPLSYVFRPDQILLISEPVVCMGALWVPYRRDPKMMKAILDAGNYLNSNNDTETIKNAEIGSVLTKEVEKISIIFCHADIQGASMNDGMRCREGLDISAFPPNLPIYSGHFHKPHTVSTALRTYISEVYYPHRVVFLFCTFSVFLVILPFFVCFLLKTQFFNFILILLYIYSI
jgi:hypothetical protein